MWIQRLLFLTIKAYKKLEKHLQSSLRPIFLKYLTHEKNHPFFSVIRNKDSTCLDLFSFYRFLFISELHPCISVSPDEGGVGCGLLPLTALPGQAGMLTLPEALENLLHLQSMNSGILVAGYLGQLQSVDTLEDAGSTFPRRLLQWFLNVLCIIMAWEALSMYAPALSRTYWIRGFRGYLKPSVLYKSSLSESQKFLLFFRTIGIFVLTTAFFPRGPQ